MKREIDPKIVYGIIGFLVLLVAFIYIRSASDQVVPESEIKSPPPPGGAFPGKLPPSAQGASGQSTPPVPTE